MYTPDEVHDLRDNNAELFTSRYEDGAVLYVLDIWSIR